MERDDELKAWLIVRGDLPEMTAGKLAVQSGHAYVLLAEEARLARPEAWRDYLAASMPKITVKAPNMAALERAAAEAKAAGIPAVSVVDEGRTCFAGPTPTVVALGPCRRADLPKFVARLQLLKDERPALPEDFASHREAWRDALLGMRAASEGGDRAYWNHELRAFDRAYAQAGLAPAREAEPESPGIR